MPSVTAALRTSRPSRVDVVIAAAFVVLVVAEAALNQAVDSPLRHLLLSVPAMTALAWRRLLPLVVALLVVATNFFANPEGEFSTLLSLVLVCFTVGHETLPPRSWFGLAVVLMPFLGFSTWEGLEPSDVAAAFVFLVGPWLVGSALRHRSETAAEALARVDRLEREQELQATAAAAQERVRIARELHDIVSHSISVVAVQTQAVRRRLGPENAREAADLAAVEATAREAMAELRRLFGVLRAEGETVDLAPQPGMAELDRLLDQIRSAGVPVDLVRTGTPYPLQPGVDLAAYRIVQEAVTNVLRHAEASRVAVTITYGATALEVTVEDDGRGLDTEPDRGHGLKGIRERAELYGGTLEIGRAVRGGVRISAHLPVRETETA